MEQSSFEQSGPAAVPTQQGRPAGWYADPQNPQQKRYFDGQAWTGHHSAPVRHRAAQPKAGSRSPSLTIVIVLLTLLVGGAALYVGRGVVDSWLHPHVPAHVKVPKTPGFKDGTESAWGRWTHGAEGQRYATFSGDLESDLRMLAASAGPEDVINGFYDVRQTAHRGLRLPTSPNREFNRLWDHSMRLLIGGSDCLTMDPACRETFRQAARELDRAAGIFNRTDTAWRISARAEG